MTIMVNRAVLAYCQFTEPRSVIWPAGVQELTLPRVTNLEGRRHTCREHPRPRRGRRGGQVRMPDWNIPACAGTTVT
ncbi:hypothetical protein ACIP79_36025 [Streptomyces sp. NPDC088747]|uniref:hypothetical protein n=1 Tax=Streptomyces sp. NPDC088747 TaxID=3365886 RepID=UPI0037F4D93F